MVDIKIEIHDDIISVLDKVLAVEDDEVGLEIPSASPLFQNKLNLKYVMEQADKHGKSLFFKTEDGAGHPLIATLETEEFGEASDFVPKNVPIDDFMEESSKPKRKFKVSFPSLPSLPKIRVPQVKRKFLAILLIALVLLFGGGYLTMVKVPKATVNVVVSSQPLIKSVTVKVKNNGVKDIENKIISGKTVSTTISDSVSTETTGELIIGSKAKGRVKIYNKTDESREFKKGEELKYEKKDDEYVYILDDTVNVPAREEQATSEPGTQIYVSGEAEADVIATEIGEEYNLDEDENLEFDDHSDSDYEVVVVSDIDGGLSKSVQAVSEEDKERVSAEALEKITQKANQTLKNEVSDGYKKISGSENSSVISEQFSAAVGAEADELTVTQTVNISALSYSEEELEDLLDELLVDFVPDGFELISDEKEVNVEILGNSDSTILSSQEADLQVTIKSYVIPEINEDEILDKILGASMEDAKKVLGGIRNVETYEVKVTPSIPFMRKVPQSKENISLNIEKK